MHEETEGIVLKQIKALNGRRMILLFSKKYGKISAGTSISERAKSRPALALRPFTHGRYGIYKTAGAYHINSAEVVKAYYKIGEDIEKYMCASYILEFTEKLLPENMPSPEIFKLLLDFFGIMEKRKKKYMTVVIAFQLKAIQHMGLEPEINQCIHCGKQEGLVFFGVKEGGALCGGCRNIIVSGENALLYNIDFDIIAILKYFFGNGLKSMENIALDEKIVAKLRVIINDYAAYHLDIKGIKSEEFLKD